MLRNHLAGQDLISFTTILISTQPAAPLFGGGTDNIAFLLGDNNTPPKNPNANAIRMTAVFWIETIQEKIIVPVYKPGRPPHFIKGAPRPGAPTPIFLVKPPTEITAPKTITVNYTQIQYSQTVFLNFNGLTWPHVSVATLVAESPIEVLL